jgi:hypothetical protein
MDSRIAGRIEFAEIEVICHFADRDYRDYSNTECANGVDPQRPGEYRLTKPPHVVSPVESPDHNPDTYMS